MTNRCAALRVVVLATIVSPAIAASSEDGGVDHDAAQFTETALSLLDLAQHSIDEGDFESALRQLHDAELFDAKVEPIRRAKLRARAIALRDDPKLRAEAAAHRAEQEAAANASSAQEALAAAQKALTEGDLDAVDLRLGIAERLGGDVTELKAQLRKARDAKGQALLAKAWEAAKANRPDEAREAHQSAVALGVDDERLDVAIELTPAAKQQKRDEERKAREAERAARETERRAKLESAKAEQEARKEELKNTFRKLETVDDDGVISELVSACLEGAQSLDVLHAWCSASSPIEGVTSVAWMRIAFKNSVDKLAPDDSRRTFLNDTIKKADAQLRSCTAAEHEAAQFFGDDCRAWGAFLRKDLGGAPGSPAAKRIAKLRGDVAGYLRKAAAATKRLQQESKSCSDLQSRAEEDLRQYFPRK